MMDVVVVAVAVVLGAVVHGSEHGAYVRGNTSHEEANDRLGVTVVTANVSDKVAFSGGTSISPVESPV